MWNVVPAGRQNNGRGNGSDECSESVLEGAEMKFCLLIMLQDYCSDQNMLAGRSLCAMAGKKK